MNKKSTYMWMITHHSIFAKVFALWPSTHALARDMDVPHYRARQWRVRQYASPWYWPKLIDLAHQRFGKVFTYRQFVEAAVALRGPKKIKKATLKPPLGAKRKKSERTAEAA